MNFAILKKSADVVARNCAVAHDLFRQGSPDAMMMLDQIVSDFGLLKQQAEELQAAKLARLQAE